MARRVEPFHTAERLAVVRDDALVILVTFVGRSCFIMRISRVCWRQSIFFRILETVQGVKRGLKDPFIGKPPKEELAGLWSLPVSHHRISYQIETSVITVVFVGPRRDVYERLRELLTEK